MIRRMLSTIAQAASDLLAVFGDEPAYASELVTWAVRQTEAFSLRVKRHVLASSAGVPSLEEAEVYRTLQASLELQESYVFREAITPWEKEVLSDPSSPKPNPNPFDYTPEGKSDVSLYF
ncbi:AMP deaminase [Sarracenia purpurea var. burkii]